MKKLENWKKKCYGKLYSLILQSPLNRCHCTCPCCLCRDILLSQAGCPLTLVVFTLFPEEQLQPFRSGRTLHSSPSRHGCIWHHHFCSTIEATGDRKMDLLFSIGFLNSLDVWRGTKPLFSHHWKDWVLRYASFHFPKGLNLCRFSD